MSFSSSLQHKCVAVGRKRAHPNITVFEEIQLKDGFGIIPEEQWDQSQRNMLVCAECCDTELCNVKGCGELGENCLYVIRKYLFVI
ncbi:hypothetical protein CHS0354_042419 [Potamilus streckersoni]|uniref:Uncharacterized protein n=1 Tax=Potamilus streckersoni TaxID=2493646 RepID=A0AAE0W0Z8_9BIVA|nr:hypothetical protein CHS0354_042419 [Potamilus streckersoni]